MAASTEARLTTNLIKTLREKGAYANKNHGGPNSQGRPDIEGCYKGLHFGFEVKLPGKEKNVTKLQRSQLKKIKAAGGVSSVVSSKSDIKTLLKAMDKLADASGLDWPS